MKTSILLALGLAACNTCGTFSYRGYEVEEHCGSVYGTQGIYFQGNEAAGLVFEADTPLDRPGIDWGFYYGAPHLEVSFWVEDMVKGNELGPEDVLTTCTWAEAPGPWDSEPTYHSGEATDFWLEVGRPVVNTDWTGDDLKRRFSWYFECGDGEVWSEGSDVVLLRARTGSASGIPE